MANAPGTSGNVMKWLPGSIARALRMDLAELEWVQRDPQVRRATIELMHGGLRGFLRSAGVFLVVGLRELFRRDARRPPPRPVVFVSFATNHVEALAPVARHVSAAYFTRINIFGRGPLHLDGGFDASFPLGIAHLASVPFLPVLIWRWVTARGWLREVFTRFFGAFWSAYGLSIAGEWWLRKLRASALVVANDHNTHTRVLAACARRLRIPTFYVQHASVTERFPPLSFDHALLDGEDALRKYASAGVTDCTTWLVGMSKLDGRRLAINSRPGVRTVGICTNFHDPVERVEELCRVILSSFPGIQIILRARPSGPGQEWVDLADNLRIERSRIEIEPVTDFLQRTDVLIAGESAVLLEAAVLDVAPLYYDFSGRRLDWYGYVSPPEAVAILHEWRRARPSARSLASYFCETIGTGFEGRSGELAASVIDDVLAGAVHPMWRSSRVAGIRTFRLAEIAPKKDEEPHRSRTLRLH
jgi:hypothetical protein